MANKNKGTSRDITFLLLFGILAIGTILFVVTTDVFTLLSVTGLTLDATDSRGTLDQRGVDASTGQFKGTGNILDFIDRFTGRLDDFFNKLANDRIKFERPITPTPPDCRRGACSMNPPDLRPTPPKIPDTPMLPPIIPPDDPICLIIECIENPQTITVIDLRDGSITNVDAVDGVKGGGGVASSSVTEQGIPEFILNKVIVHERFHTPANGQTVSGSLLLEWGHGGSITVQQFLVPNEYFDWFEFDLPQTIRGDGAITFDGKSEGEFFYKLTIPNDLINEDTVIPVRLVINTQNAVVDGLTEIQIERSEPESQTISIAEIIRSIFTDIRSSFA